MREIRVKVEDDYFAVTVDGKPELLRMLKRGRVEVEVEVSGKNLSFVTIPPGIEVREFANNPWPPTVLVGFIKKEKDDD